MKQKILEVQNYFAYKLSKGQYKVEKIDDYVLTVVVDRKYRFSLWIANEEPSFRTYDGRDNFISVTFTAAERKTGYRFAKRHHKAWTDTAKKESDLAQLRKLQEKYPDAN